MKHNPGLPLKQQVLLAAHHVFRATQRALFSTPCKVAVLMSSDLFGILQRLDLPGSFGRETWCDRLMFLLEEFVTRTEFGERVQTAQHLIHECGRALDVRAVDAKRERVPSVRSVRDANG